jgi:hypothetical protein
LLPAAYTDTDETPRTEADLLSPAQAKSVGMGLLVYACVAIVVFRVLLVREQVSASPGPAPTVVGVR